MLVEAAHLGGVGLRAENEGFLPYLYISTESRPFSLPQAKAIGLRDALVEYHRDYGTGNAYRIERLKECGSPVVGGISGWNYRCNLPECPLCYRRRAYRKVAESKRLDRVLQESGFGSQMLTITVPDVEDAELQARYAALSEANSRLLRSKTYRNHFSGAARCIETSVADTGCYHVHVHLLVVFVFKNQPDIMQRLLERYFPDATALYFSEPEHGVHTARFAAYALKLPEGVTPAEWLNIRTMTQGKNPLTFSGVFRQARQKTNQQQKRIQ